MLHEILIGRYLLTGNFCWLLVEYLFLCTKKKETKLQFWCYKHTCNCSNKMGFSYLKRQTPEHIRILWNGSFYTQYVRKGVRDEYIKRFSSWNKINNSPSIYSQLKWQQTLKELTSYKLAPFLLPLFRIWKEFVNGSNHMEVEGYWRTRHKALHILN